MTDHCNHMTYPEALETPAEWCDEETVAGQDYCDLHLDDHDE